MNRLTSRHGASQAVVAPTRLLLMLSLLVGGSTRSFASAQHFHPTIKPSFQPPAGGGGGDGPFNPALGPDGCPTFVPPFGWVVNTSDATQTHQLLDGEIVCNSLVLFFDDPEWTKLVFPAVRRIKGSLVILAATSNVTVSFPALETIDAALRIASIETFASFDHVSLPSILRLGAELEIGSSTPMGHSHSYPPSGTLQHLGHIERVEMGLASTDSWYIFAQLLIGCEVGPAFMCGTVGTVELRNVHAICYPRIVCDEHSPAIKVYTDSRIDNVFINTGTTPSSIDEDVLLYVGGSMMLAERASSHQSPANISVYGTIAIHQLVAVEKSKGDVSLGLVPRDSTIDQVRLRGHPRQNMTLLGGMNVVCSDSVSKDRKQPLLDIDGLLGARGHVNIVGDDCPISINKRLVDPAQTLQGCQGRGFYDPQTKKCTCFAPYIETKNNGCMDHGAAIELHGVFPNGSLAMDEDDQPTLSEMAVFQPAPSSSVQLGGCGAIVHMGNPVYMYAYLEDSTGAKVATSLYFNAGTPYVPTLPWYQPYSLKNFSDGWLFDMIATSKRLPIHGEYTDKPRCERKPPVEPSSSSSASLPGQVTSSQTTAGSAASASSSTGLSTHPAAASMAMRSTDRQPMHSTYAHGTYSPTRPTPSSAPSGLHGTMLIIIVVLSIVGALVLFIAFAILARCYRRLRNKSPYSLLPNDVMRVEELSLGHKEDGPHVSGHGATADRDEAEDDTYAGHFDAGPSSLTAFDNAAPGAGLALDMFHPQPSSLPAAQLSAFPTSSGSLWEGRQSFSDDSPGQVWPASHLLRQHAVSTRSVGDAPVFHLADTELTDLSFADINSGLAMPSVPHAALKALTHPTRPDIAAEDASAPSSHKLPVANLVAALGVGDRAYLRELLTTVARTHDLRRIWITEDEQSLLHYACLNSCPASSIDTAAEARPELIEQRDSHGRTPLFCCCEVGHISALDALLRRNANPNAQSDAFLTPAMAAVQKGHISTLELLSMWNTRRSAFRCDMGQKDKQGWTALFWAAACGEKACFDYLLSNFNLNVNDRDLRGQTVMDILEREGNAELGAILAQYRPQLRGRMKQIERKSSYQLTQDDRNNDLQMDTS